MQSFKYFVESLLSEGSNNLRGSIGGGESSKAIGHVRDYIAPFLSKQQVSRSIEQLHPLDDRFKKIPKENGSQYNPDAESTHTLGANVANKVGTHAKGTRITVTGVRAHPDGKRLIVTTKKHGEFSMASLEKPESLRKANVSGERGFSVEKRISKNLGTTAAGSTGASHDFFHNGKKHGTGRKLVRGVVKEVGETPQPNLVRGESKLDKGKMGQGVLKFDQTSRKWGISSKAGSAISEHMKKARVVGPDGKERDLLDHLNTHHSDGKISKGFVAQAPTGMARAYLRGINANCLHLHNKKTDTGTTFTINDELKGKTNLGHLGRTALDNLDGKINIERTTSGTANIIHRPNHTEMKRLSLFSSSKPEEHRDLTREDHAKEFVKHVNSID